MQNNKYLCLFLFFLSLPAFSKTPKEYQKEHAHCVRTTPTVNNGTIIGCADNIVQKTNRDIRLVYYRIYRKIANRDKDSAFLFMLSQKSWADYKNQTCSLEGSLIGSPVGSLCEMDFNLERLKLLNNLEEQL